MMADEAEDLGRGPMVAVLVLDTLTGATGWERRVDLYSWTDGNWSCDCNRKDAVGVELPDTGYCVGEHRFLAIACDCAGVSYEEMNDGYPEALLEEFRPRWLGQVVPPQEGA